MEAIRDSVCKLAGFLAAMPHYARLWGVLFAASFLPRCLWR